MAYRIIIIDDEKEISGGFAMFFPWKMLGYRVAEHISALYRSGDICLHALFHLYDGAVFPRDSP